MTAADGSVSPAFRLVDHGPVERRFNLVVLADGFQAGELRVFRAAVADLVNELRSLRPLRQLWPLINVFRIDVSSVESGIDHPIVGVFRRTFFDATATGRGPEVLVNDALVHRTCRRGVSPYHVALVIANDPGDLGASPYDVACVTLGTTEPLARVVLHELGHAAFGLADEYDTPSSESRYVGPEPPGANCTAVTASARVKWRALRPTPLPVVPNSNCAQPSANEGGLPVGELGVFAGADQAHCGKHRPSGTCMMRALAQPLCAVCIDRMETVMRRFRPLAIERSRFSFAAEALTATVVTLPSGPHVLTYAVGRGEAVLRQVGPDATTLAPKLVTSLGLGWTAMVPLTLGTGAHVLLYEALTGRTELSKVAPDASAITTVFPTTRPSGATVLTSFVLAGRSYVLAYDSIAGRATIDEVAADGTGLLRMFDSLFGPGLTAFTAVERVDPHQPGIAPGGGLLVGYRPDTGLVVQLLVGPRGTSVTEVQRFTTMPFATAFVPVTAHGELIIALHNAVTGDVRWVYAGDLGLPLAPTPPPASSFSLSEIGQSAWSAGWTAIATFDIAGQTHWLAYRASDGTAVLDRID